MPPKPETQVKDGDKQPPPPPPPPGFPTENPEKKKSKRLFEWKSVAVGAVKSVAVGAVKSVKKIYREECACCRECGFF